MAFIETFLYSFFISILANKTPGILNKLKSISSIDDVKLKKLFTKTMLDTLMTYKNNVISETLNSEINDLRKAIKNDDTKLYILIEIISKNEKRNFLNTLEDNEKKFLIKLF